MPISLIKRVLHRGRHIILLLTITLGIIAVGLWWFLPDLNTLSPNIERALKQKVPLQSLHLGDASWQWNGSVGLRFNNSSLQTSDHKLRIQDADITAYIALSELIMGRVLPDTIHLQGGSIHLNNLLKKDSEENVKIATIPPLQLILDDVHLSWQSHQQHGELEHVNVDVDMADQTIIASATGLKINGHWQQDDTQINIAFDDLNWLPKAWTKDLQGELSGQLSLQQLENGHWIFNTAFNAPQRADLNFPKADFRLPFNHLSLQLTLIPTNTSTDTLPFERIQIDQFHWQLAKNTLQANGAWQQGLLTLDLNAPYFDMPVMWSFLHPIDTGPWDQWLDRMQHGSGHNAVGSIQLAWEKPWQAPPGMKNLSDMRFQMQAVAKDADIFLGMEDAITHTHADVSLDENGLEAIVHDTQLPHGIGHAQGRFYIPWNTLVLKIDGKSDHLDAGKLHTWLDATDAALLQYKDIPASGDISLIWMPLEDEPRNCILNLTPIAPWTLQPLGVPIEVNKGLLTWNLQQGIQLQNMQLSIAQLTGTTSLRIKRVKETSSWGLQSLDTKLKGKWDNMIQNNHIPIASPTGEIALSLHYEHNTWQGDIDASQAGWANLLGSKKKIGESFRLHISSKEKSNTHLRFQTDSPTLQLNGTGTWEPSGLRVQFNPLVTPSFDGKIDLWSPFNQDPVELNITAKYLNRTMLPTSRPQTTATTKTPWILHSSIDLLEWGKSNLHHANIHLNSTPHLNGKIQAKVANFQALQLQNLDISFAIMDQGIINLHHVSASLDDHHINLSGTLDTASPDALKWQGFVDLKGNFGQLLKQTGVSQLFENGYMNLLFSGHGRFTQHQPWWNDLTGRLRLRVQNGRVMEGGNLSKLLAAISLIDFPLFLIGQRADLTSSGMLYRDMQADVILDGKNTDIRKFILHSSAMDIAGEGSLNLDQKLVDMIMIVRPFQNIDAILSVIPIIRNILGGDDYSFIRKIYRMHGPITDTKIDTVSPREAGVASSGLIEGILTLPQALFGNKNNAPASPEHENIVDPDPLTAPSILPEGLFDNKK